jgi:flavin reductase (DIM6/NTAB) family NADH-FMN oxidoreductase RutF
LTLAHLTAPDIAAMASQARALLINSLPGYKSAMLVGTSDAEGQTNLAIVSSHFHLGSSPPLLAMILRPSTGRSERHTLHNLLETRCWTLNGFTLDHAAQAHQTSVPYPKDQSEFDACGFEAEWLAEFNAPFIKSSPLQVGCLLREHHPLEINSTHMIIGEVHHLHFPETAQRNDGGLSLDTMGLVAVAGLDTYTQPEAGVRFAPADRTSPPRQL